MPRQSCKWQLQNLQPTVKYFRCAFFLNCGAPGDGRFWQLRFWLSSNSVAIAEANRRGITAFMVDVRAKGECLEDQKIGRGHSGVVSIHISIIAAPILHAELTIWLSVRCNFRVGVSVVTDRHRKYITR